MSVEMTTWRKLLKSRLAHTEEEIEELFFNVPLSNLDVEFELNYGSPNGIPFIAWGPNFVYYSSDYDGLDKVRYVQRNPLIKADLGEHAGRDYKKGLFNEGDEDESE